MSGDKQIEGMDCKRCLHYEACLVAFRNSKKLGIYENDYTEEEYFNSTLDCDYYLDKNIYRKASDVAREIFQEINSCLDYIEEQLEDIPDAFVSVVEDIEALERKYTQDKEKIPPYVIMEAKALPATLNVKYTEEGK